MIVWDFLDVFTDDQPSVPLERQVELRIDLIPGVTSIGKDSYRLAPSKIHNLSSQL